MARDSVLSQDLSGLMGHVDVRNLTLFCRQLSTLLNVGLPLLRALQILAERTSNMAVRRKIRKIAEHVEKGKSLSVALAEESGTFDEFFVNTVRAGEEGGILQKTLALLADYLEKDESIRRRMKSVLLYPGITLLLAAVVLIFILLGVVPRFQEAYEATSIQNVPSYTQFVLDTSWFLRTYLYHVLGGIGLLLVLVFAAGRTRMGRRVLDAILLRVPVLGSLYRKILIYRFCSLMRLLLESGLSGQRAMEICARAAGNAQLERALLRIAESITRGRSIEASFREQRIFPDLFVDMLAVGEEAGAISNVMLKLSETYEEEVDNTLENLGLLLEPILVLLIGSVVLLIAVSVFVPYLSMSEAFLEGR
jgi:type IV pilus assembly protein PilC